MKPELILDRTETCQKLGISRQTLISWVRKGKLKVWKRVGHGTNAALLFERKHVEVLCSNNRSGLSAALLGAQNSGNPDQGDENAS